MYYNEILIHSFVNKLIVFDFYALGVLLIFIIFTKISCKVTGESSLADALNSRKWNAYYYAIYGFFSILVIALSALLAQYYLDSKVTPAPVPSIAAHYDVSNIGFDRTVPNSYKMYLPSGKVISCIYDENVKEHKFRLTSCVDGSGNPTTTPFAR